VDILGVLIIDEAMSAFDVVLMLSHFGIKLFALGSEPTVVGGHVATVTGKPDDRRFSLCIRSIPC
jgi:hypothetical protein